MTEFGAGAATQDLAIGDRVYLAAANCLASRVRVYYDGLARLPDWLDFEQGASLAMASMMAYHYNYRVAHLQPGESVLIHSATDAVAQAAVMMAQNIGAEIFVTVGSVEKREFIETYGISADHIFNGQDESVAEGMMEYTHGKCVEVVLNSLEGPLLRATWSCVASFGRFVEIGKRNIDQDMHFRWRRSQNVSYAVRLICSRYSTHGLGNSSICCGGLIG